MRGTRGKGLGGMPWPGLLRRDQRAGTARTDSDRITEIAEQADLDVEDVLRDVADFRLALETDLIIAAAAMDAEAPALAAEMVDGERAELADFHDRLLERLVDAAARDELESRRTRRERSRYSGVMRTLAGAAAAIALVGAAQAVRTPDRRPETQNAGNAKIGAAGHLYAQLSSAVQSNSPAAVQAAAIELHETLETLITEHAGDPAIAQQAAQLLQAEINLLQFRAPAGASMVLAQARNLASQLRRTAPAGVRESVAPVLDAAAPAPKPKTSARPATSPSPTKSPTSSPSPTKSPTSSPSSSASSSSQPSSSPPPQNPPLPV